MDKLKPNNFGWKRIVPLIYNKPLLVVLRELYLKHGTIGGVAEELGVSRVSIYSALRASGIATLKPDNQK